MQPRHNVIFVVVALLSALLGSAAMTAGRLPSRTPSFSLEQFTYSQTPGQFSLSPDGRHAVYGFPGRYFGHPLVPDFGYANNLRLVSLDNGATTWLTSGANAKTNPRFSPDGRWVAYESENDIWRVSIETGRMERLTLSPSEDRSPVWSPDSREIAFVSTRRGGTRIWVMAADGEYGRLRQVTRVQMGYQDLQWSPDGELLLFTAQPAADHFYSNAIFTVPAAGGEPRRLTPRDDHAYQEGRWSPDGSTIAFLSDRSGFFNIWRMDHDGDEMRPLTTLKQEHGWTHKDYQNDTAVWSPDGLQLLYFVNRGGNFDLWAMEVSGGESRRISDVEGCHHPVGWLDSRTVSYVYENHFTPPDLHVAPLSGPGRQVTYSGQTAYRQEHFGRFDRVSFDSADGLAIHGYLLTPMTVQRGERFPGLVMLHTYNPGQFYHQFNPIFSYIVESGYVMLLMDQRGSVGYGREFTLKSVGEWGGRQVDDVAAGAAFLRRHSAVDPARLGVMGYSFGGYQTYWALIKTPDLFRAGVSLFGPADRRNRPQPSKGWTLHIGGPEDEMPELWAAASPATQVEPIRAPVLIIGGASDRIVHVGQTYTMATALERAGKAFELVMYPNEEHGLRILEHQLDSYRRVLAFLDRHLKP